MTFRTFILEKTGALPNEMIHISLRCVVHLHDHQNKMVPLMKPLYLWILTMVLRFATTPIGRLMTFEATVFRIRSVTTTSTTKT
jgi:hypothetical protein